MSVFAARAPQILAMEPRVGESQFHGRNGGSSFCFVSRHWQSAKRRTALAIIGFAL
jgi:hypothetical protein